MNSKNWKYVFSSRAGTSHEKNSTPCQDCSDCQVLTAADGKEILIAVVADGAGSATFAEIASKLVCLLVVEEMRAFFEFESDTTKLNTELIQDLVSHIQKELSYRAEDTGSRLRDYASTVLVAIVGEASAVFAQIGDGAIVVSTPDEPDVYSWIFWPKKGEYENTTFFITDDNAVEIIQIEFLNRAISKVAMFTDGLQSLALHYQTQTVHSPFFRPLFGYLGSVQEDAFEKIVIPVERFLDSQQVNERTDDDKTILLALRIMEA